MNVPPPGTAVPPPGGGATPPPAGGAPPPPPGGGAPPPGGQQPQTGGYAAQFGLIRPVNNRYVAGVCGALGRATNTDPVLWRVLLPVLMVVGLLGGIIYLLGWLLFPSEGDSASPFEALIGRGHSSMSKIWTLFLTVFTAIIAASGFAVGRGGRFLLFAAVIAGAVVLVTSRNPRAGWPSQPSNPRPPWAPPMNAPPPAWTPSGATGEAGPTSEWNAATMASAPTMAQPPTAAATQPAYQPPFAPHGPYATADPYSAADPYPTTPYPPTEVGPPLTPLVVPRPPKPTGPRRAILSCIVLAVGLLGALDLSNLVSVPVPAYFAVALAVLGLGMIVASFFGRVRGPVTLGVLLAIGLLVSSAISTFHGDYNNTYNFKPASVAGLSDTYRENTGRMTLDLSDLDLSGTHTVHVRLNVGLVQVIVPRNTDVTVSSRVNVGATDAFGRHQGGIGNGALQVTNNGPDGPGGGTLILDANVNVGKVEVSR
jgi:phage shock protein PspC (stress-responsive transcriptional regulator)